jgi:DNA-binding MarR family transcriptional regulator
MKRRATNREPMIAPRIDSESAARPRDEVNNRLFFRLFQTANLYETQAVRELNCSAVQGAVLGALSRNVEQGMSFSALYTYLAVSRQNLDAVLKRLEQAGYVVRVEGESDRRIRIVRLTAKGAEAWRDLRARSSEFFRQGTDGISTAEVSACVEALAKIGRALKAID